MTGFAATGGSVPPADWSEFQRIAAGWGCEPCPLPAETTAFFRGHGVLEPVVTLLDGIGLAEGASPADPADEDDPGGPGVSYLGLASAEGLPRANAD